MRRGRLAGVVSGAAAIVAVVCGVLVALAVNLLGGPSAAAGSVAVAAGQGGGVSAGTPAGPGVTAPVRAVGSAPAPAAQAAVLTPQRNPPLMAQGSEGEDVRELQVRLAHLGLFDADVTGYFGNVTATSVRSYQASKGAEPTAEIYQDIWSSLQAETPEPTEDQLYPPPPAYEPPTVVLGTLDARCATGRVLCIDKTDQVLRWVVNGRILLEMDARFGRPGMETSEGQFSVYWKHRDHVSSIYEADMPFSMFFSGGEAVHYSGEFAAIGYSGVGSHGCVNIRDWDGISWLFDQVSTGDKVIVYWS